MARLRSFLLALVAFAALSGTASAAPRYPDDLAPPVVVFKNNLGTYDIDDTIDITCVATDDSSGLLRDACQQAQGPAVSFGIGTHRLRSFAVDRAGHTTYASTLFTVKVTAASFCSHSRKKVPGSAAGRVCQQATAAEAAALAGDRLARSRAINEIVREIRAVRTMTQSDAEELMRFARALALRVEPAQQPASTALKKR